MFRRSQIAVGFTTRGRGSFFHLSSVESFLICGTVEGIVNFGDLFEIHKPEGMYGREFEPHNWGKQHEKTPDPNK